MKTNYTLVEIGRIAEEILREANSRILLFYGEMEYYNELRSMFLSLEM